MDIHGSLAWRGCSSDCSPAPDPPWASAAARAAAWAASRRAAGSAFGSGRSPAWPPEGAGKKKEDGIPWKIPGEF